MFKRSADRKKTLAEREVMNHGIKNAFERAEKWLALGLYSSLCLAWRRVASWQQPRTECPPLMHLDSQKVPIGADFDHVSDSGTQYQHCMPKDSFLWVPSETHGWPVNSILVPLRSHLPNRCSAPPLDLCSCLSLNLDPSAPAISLFAFQGAQGGWLGVISVLQRPSEQG